METNESGGKHPNKITEDGIYILQEAVKGHPKSHVVIYAYNGRLFAMAPTHELSIDGFTTDAKVTGPFK